MGWGLDVHWAALAREHGWRCGVVDAVAIRHRAAPAGAAYAREAAIAEARAFLAERPYLTRARGRTHPRDPPALVSGSRSAAGPRVAVVAEFYPSRRDPVLGVWAHRQALAARDAGAEVRVLVLHRLVPPRASLAAGRRRGGAASCAARCASRARRCATACPSTTSPTSRRRASAPTPRWGAWAAPRSRSRCGGSRARSRSSSCTPTTPSPPATRCAARARACRWWSRCTAATCSTRPGATPPGARAVARGLGAARLVLANSQGIAELARARGARRDARRAPRRRPPAAQRRARARLGRRPAAPTLVTVAHLVARKRHADVLRALAVLAPRHPTLRYSIIGDGPERVALEGLAARLGVAERVDFLGQLAPQRGARARARLHAVRDALHRRGLRRRLHRGDGRRACRRSAAAASPGPEEIAAAGDGFVLVPPGDIERLTQRIDELLSDPHRLREAGQRARATVAANFTWERCGAQTLAAYAHALR